MSSKVTVAPGALSPRALAWLEARSAVRDPERTAPPATLRALCAERGMEVPEAAFDFEESFGGVGIPGDAGVSWFGVAQGLLRAPSPGLDQGGAVPIGDFPSGGYWMDAQGRILADDGVMERFLIAQDWRRLVERFAIGQEYPRAAFTWPGRFAVEPVEDIAAGLAAALGAARVDELSDDCQAVYQRDDIALWAPPAFAEMSAAPCTVVCSGLTSIRAVLETLRDHFPGVGAHVGVSGAMSEALATGAIPPRPAGLRYELWFDPEAIGVIELCADGSVEQWIEAGGQVTIERLTEAGTRRVRYLPAG